MKVNNITRLMVACLWCCCTIVFAKTHINEQVDQNVQDKIELEQQKEAEANNASTTEPEKTEPAKEVKAGPKSITSEKLEKESTMETSTKTHTKAPCRFRSFEFRRKY